ncbi:hypothetical protein [Candidatus Puniceispirillum marinum]|uniref:YCII-related domain-containing protein n=1 Tax=Puniceispirillum marinum (strain IMCC1322) TaxID=488538 RepID=D5BNW5_PUNMI|nr:hypothetical protein [Candidatus Puniceispirillum marinum]ADE40399.1 hypothetical protein SAR116_2156 [Candidatus Puniceispirillum marinum IMCC1322]
MPKFLFAYHGGKMPETEVEIAAEMQRWRDWMDGLGDALVDPGNPVGMSSTVSIDGVVDNGGANPVSGYSLVAADDMNAALAMAAGCPMVTQGHGSIEVAETHNMDF